MAIRFIDYNGKRISYKKIRFTASEKGCLNKKKWDQVKVFWLNFKATVRWKSSKKPYLITLSPAFLGPEGPLEWTEGGWYVFST